MKKILAFLLCILMTVTLFSCGDKENTSDMEYEIAFITESEEVSIDDKGAVQDAWEGLRAFAEEKNHTYKYYEPVEDSKDGRLEQIDRASQAGAKFIACVGNSFDEVISAAQGKYEDIRFIHIDGTSADDTGKNCVRVNFREVEAGYLAGYSAVKEGYTSLGFMGADNSAAMKNYGYGFVQGCNQAAKEMALTADIKYSYCDKNETAAKTQKRAEDWYKSGTEVIFVCGDDIFDSVAVEADIAKGKVISGRLNKNDNKVVIGSATENPGEAIKLQLASAFGDNFAGGKNLILGTKDEAVGFIMKKNTWERFTQKDYRDVYRQLQKGKIKLKDAADAKTVKKLISSGQMYSVDVTAV